MVQSGKGPDEIEKREVIEAMVRESFACRVGMRWRCCAAASRSDVICSRVAGDCERLKLGRRVGRYRGDILD